MEKDRSIEYSRANRINNSSLKSLIGNNYAKDRSLVGSVTKAISDKTAAKATRIKETLDPLNIISSLPIFGNILSYGLGKAVNRSERDLQYFTGYGKPRKQREKKESVTEETKKKTPSLGRVIGGLDTASYTSVSEGNQQKFRRGDGLANLLARQLNLMKAYNEEEKKWRKQEIKAQKIRDNERMEWNKKILSAAGISFAGGPNEKEEDDDSILGDILSAAGAAAIIKKMLGWAKKLSRKIRRSIFGPSKRELAEEEERRRTTIQEEEKRRTTTANEEPRRSAVTEDEEEKKKKTYKKITSPSKEPTEIKVKLTAEGKFDEKAYRTERMREMVSRNESLRQDQRLGQKRRIEIIDKEVRDIKKNFSEVKQNAVQMTPEEKRIAKQEDVRRRIIEQERGARPKLSGKSVAEARASVQSKVDNAPKVTPEKPVMPTPVTEGEPSSKTGIEPGKMAAKFATKVLLKSLIQDIPVAGQLLTLGFSGYRAVQGDYSGALLELGGLIPVLNTASNLALMVHDSVKSLPEQKTEDDARPRGNKPDLPPAFLPPGERPSATPMPATPNPVTQKAVQEIRRNQDEKRNAAARPTLGVIDNSQSQTNVMKGKDNVSYGGSFNVRNKESTFAWVSKMSTRQV